MCFIALSFKRRCFYQTEFLAINCSRVCPPVSLIFMAAPGTQVVGKPVRGTGSSPKTPGNTGLVEAAGLPLQITPLESIETESTNPNTPHKVR